MKAVLTLIVAALPLFTATVTFSQQTWFPRLSRDVFDVVPPSARVQGTIGQMTVQRSACRSLPAVETRRRIVDVAIQEWTFFGFSIVDPDADEDDFRFDPADISFGDQRFGRLSPSESARVAASIAGYWAATPEGPGIVSSQNRAWNGPDGAGARWIAPWSAAFLSWVMCESGLATGSRFQRAIAHHVYIDQAIRARAGNMPGAAFDAYDPGETVVEPGDLLCTSRRPVYRNLAERRRQMGEGARTHCDIVVKVDEAGRRIFAIGGNVRRSVSMKLLPAFREPGKYLRPVDQITPRGPRPFFAHLKLRAKPIEANAFENSPAVKALSCTKTFRQPDRVALLISSAVGGRHC